MTRRNALSALLLSFAACQPASTNADVEPPDETDTSSEATSTSQAPALPTDGLPPRPDDPTTGASGGEDSTGGESSSTGGAEAPREVRCDPEACFTACYVEADWEHELCEELAPQFQDWSCDAEVLCAESIEPDSDPEVLRCALEALRDGTPGRLVVRAFDLEPTSKDGSETTGTITVVEPGIALVSLRHVRHCYVRGYMSRRLQVRPADDPWWETCLPIDGEPEPACFLSGSEIRTDLFPFLLGTCEDAEPACPS